MFDVDAANNVTFGLAFVAGCLSFVSPCVLPLLPAYISYLGGRATMQTTRDVAVLAAAQTGSARTMVVQQNRLGTLVHAMFFVAGFSLVFVVFGMLTTASVQILQARSYDIEQLIARLGGLLIIFFGLHILGVTGWLLRGLINRVDWEALGGAGLHIRHGLERFQVLLYGDSRRQVNPRNGFGYAGSALMGVTFAAGWTPCIGPIYGAIVTLAINASKTHSYAPAATLLFAYSLGLGVPFLIAALMLDQARGLMRRLQRQMRAIEIVSGVLLIIVGGLLFFDRFSYLNQFAVGFSDFSYNLETCTTGVLSGSIPAADYVKCMQLGTNYKDQSAPVGPLAPAPSARVPLLIVGDYVLTVPA